MALVTLQTSSRTPFPRMSRRISCPLTSSEPRAIMQCRTAALGGHVQACPDGHMARSGTIRVSTGRVPNAPISKPSGGSPSSKRACWLVTIIM
jgi:hypothetical protein